MAGGDGGISDAFRQLSPTTLADVLDRRQVMDAGIHPLWAGMRRVAGPAFTVRCAGGDNLMLHAAIYHAPPGAIVVVDGTDAQFALAGGNVCAVAQRNGIAAFILDGAIRDIAEVRARQFPVFARGVIPKAGAKIGVGSMGEVITCGGVRVAPRDVVVADEEGIVVVAAAQQATVLQAAQERAAKDASQSLDAWEKDHRQRVFEILERPRTG